MLFELMQADIRRPTIKTLKDFFESDLTVHDDVKAVNTSIMIDEHFMERMAMPSTKFVTKVSNLLSKKHLNIIEISELNLLSISLITTFGQLLMS